MNKLARYAVYGTVLGSFSLVLGAQIALARTTPCGQPDPVLGYYGQCDANNNPIATNSTNPYAATSNPYSSQTNPYAVTSNPYVAQTNPYATSNTVANPTVITTTTTAQPTVGCNQYDPAQGGIVICDANGKPVSYWITHQAATTQPAYNITVNYSNPQSNNQSANPYYNASSYTNPYASSYGYGNTYNPYGNYYNAYGNGYGYGYNTGSTWGNVALGLLSYAMNSNSCGSCSSAYGGGSSYNPYQSSYSYPSGYDYSSSYYPSYNTSYDNSGYSNAGSYDYYTPEYTSVPYSNYGGEITGWSNDGGGSSSYGNEISNWAD